MDKINNSERMTNNLLEEENVPMKRYFSIGEVSQICQVKTYVLRYWEQEFTQIKPAKRKGNRRYYHYKDVLMIKTIRSLLYDQGFTISGARQKLSGVNYSKELSVSLKSLIREVTPELEKIISLLN